MSDHIAVYIPGYCYSCCCYMNNINGVGLVLTMLVVLSGLFGVSTDVDEFLWDLVCYRA